jgi:hypothetical protein
MGQKNQEGGAYRDAKWRRGTLEISRDRSMKLEVVPEMTAECVRDLTDRINTGCGGSVVMEFSCPMLQFLSQLSAMVKAGCLAPGRR